MVKKSISYALLLWLIVCLLVGCKAIKKTTTEPVFSDVTTVTAETLNINETAVVQNETTAPVTETTETVSAKETTLPTVKPSPTLVTEPQPMQPKATEITPIKPEPTENDPSKGENELGEDELL